MKASADAPEAPPADVAVGAEGEEMGAPGVTHAVLLQELRAAGVPASVPAAAGASRPAPFRWSTLPPARRPDRAPSTAPARAWPSPPAGPEYGPHELEPGEAGLAPFLPRFAVGHEPPAAELEAHHAQPAAIEGDCIARLGPLRGAAPLPEPSLDVLPERADVWRAAYQRRLAAGVDPESAARLTITTHGPPPGGIA